MQRKTMISITMIGIGLIIGCQNQRDSSDQNNRVPVEVTEIGLGEVKQSLTYNGDIKAEFEVRVFSKIPDRIETYFVDEGDHVTKGAPIAKILATTVEQAVLQAEAGLAAAEAQMANMESEYSRAEKLYKEDALSRQEYEALKTQYEAAAAQVAQAKAGLKTAKSQLDDATVTAPISGIIGERYFEVGDMASPTMPVASVVQMDRVKIQFDATETDLGKLKVGQKAEISVRSYENRIFNGELVKISPVLDPMTRMATAEVMIPNPSHELKPGMYAKLEITTGMLNDVVVIPRHVVIESTSLKTIDGTDNVVKDYYVYVVDDSSCAEQRRLRVNYINHKNIAVTSGVAVGEKLVVSGQNNLRDGLPVVIVKDEEAN